MTLAIAISVEAGDWPDEAILERWCAEAFDSAAEELDPKTKARLQTAEISIVFTDDKVVRALNRDYRGKDKPTNILSFPAAQASNAPNGIDLLGDLVLASETIRKQALDAGLSIHHHCLHLLVHGFFHLFGFDHMIDQEAEDMEAMEARALARLSVSDPYCPA